MMAFPLQDKGGADRLSCKVEKKTMAFSNPLISSSVPFKWEEAPGKPISNCNELIKGDSTATVSLQLPPKLQFQPHQYQYHSSESTPWQKSLHRMQPKSQKFKKLCKCMFRNASWSHPLHPQRSFVGQANDDQEQLVINDRFFFDKTSPQALKCSHVSIDSWQPVSFPLYEEKEDEFVCRDQSLVLDDDEESTASSPWHPIMFHEKEGAPSRWQPIMFHEREADDDGFHLYSTPSSTEKPSQIIGPFPKLNDIEPPSASPWCLDFSPDEEDAHNKGGSKKIIRLVSLIRLKNMISKVCKFKRKREANQADMWSPTLATYLYNQQKEKEEDSIECSRSPYLAENEQEDEHSRSIRGQLSLARSPYFSEEEQNETQKLTHKLILSNSEQLSHNCPFSDANDPFSEQVGSTIDTKKRVPAGKEMCIVQRTVRVLAATIKLILVQMEARGRRARCRCKPKFNLSHL